MDDDYAEVKTFEQSTNGRLDAIEREISLIKILVNSLVKTAGNLSDSDLLHHGVYR